MHSEPFPEVCALVSDKTGSRGGDQGLKIVEIIAVFWNQRVNWKESGKVAIAIS